MITDEMKDPYVLIKNVAHFYRALGKRNINIIREILIRESEILEPTAALFYEWCLSKDRCKATMGGQPSLEVMYEYAVFFLNSLAGKSYLLRRDSKVRILTIYYCILILDQANQQVINRYGLDIRPLIDASAYDIRNQRGLVAQKQYLDTLEDMRKKYERQQKPKQP